MAGYIPVTNENLDEDEALSVANDLAARAVGEVYVVPGDRRKVFGVWRPWTKSDDSYSKRIEESHFDRHRISRLPGLPYHVIQGRREGG
jgi:hypothetical protein